MSCEVCHEKLHKYTCPGCAKKTCSLQCVKQHKQDTRCSGKRDKTKFVAIKEFNDSNLLNDYRLLEETYRKVDAISRDGFRNKPYVNRYTRDLVRAARQRGVQLQCLPYPMAKRKRNKTVYVYNRDKATKLRNIVWFVDWVFTDADITYSRRCGEHSTMNELLLEFLHPSKSDPMIRHKLQQYVASLTPVPPVTLKSDTHEVSENVDMCADDLGTVQGGNSENVASPSVSQELSKINTMTSQPSTSDVNVTKVISDKSSQENPLSNCDKSSKCDPEKLDSTEVGINHVETDSLRKLACDPETVEDVSPTSDGCLKRTEQPGITKEEDRCKDEAPEEITIVKEQKNETEYNCNRVGLFLKLDNLPANVTKYKRLSLFASLAENLTGQVIVEYPTIHVALEKHWGTFDLQE